MNIILNNAPSVKTVSPKHIRLSPFYHSSVNAVTKPNKLTHTSDYFLDRWMPLLKPNGVAIVLALRRGGFLNRKTGELRDEIVISRAELAAAAGISEDTLTREMGVNKKTGKPQNEFLHLFVQKRTRSHRNCRGQLRQDESAYWVSMDDPIHKDDWHLVEQFVREAEARQEKQPETQNAFSVLPGMTQNAEARTQSAVNAPQSAEARTQNASRLKSLDSSRHKNTLQDAAVAAPEILPSVLPEQKEPEQKEPERPSIRRRAQGQVFKRVKHAPPCAAVLEQMIQARMGEIQAEDAAAAALEEARVRP